MWEGRPPPSFSYQWLLDEVPIGGATGTVLNVEPGYQGHLITCAVTASSPEGSYEADTQGVAIPYSGSATKPGGSGPGGPIKKTTSRVTIPEVEASLRSQLPHVLRAARRSKVLKSGSFTFMIAGLEAGTLSVSWYQVPKATHASSKSHKPKPILLASAKTVFTAAGKEKVKLSLTRLGRQILKQNKHLKLTVTAEFKTPKGAHGAWVGTMVLAP